MGNCGNWEKSRKKFRYIVMVRRELYNYLIYIRDSIGDGHPNAIILQYICTFTLYENVELVDIYNRMYNRYHKVIDNLHNLNTYTQIETRKKQLDKLGL